jgi:hypothetical protein
MIVGAIMLGLAIAAVAAVFAGLCSARSSWSRC